jgi:hypothetical protein
VSEATAATSIAHDSTAAETESVIRSGTAALGDERRVRRARPREALEDAEVAMIPSFASIVHERNDRAPGTRRAIAPTESVVAAPRARRHTCQAPLRSTGTASPSRVMPSTSSSGEPIMKSTWIRLALSRCLSSAEATPSW